MSYFDHFEFHKNYKRKYLAKGSNYITFSEEWRILKTELPISFAIDDFNACLNKSFGVTLNENGEKYIDFEIENGLEHKFKIIVTENFVKFVASDYAGIVQAIYYAEDLMRQFGDASLQIKEYFITPVVWPRLVTSSLDGGVYNKEYLNVILHYGYNGVIFYYHDENALKNAKDMGLMVYYGGEDDSFLNLYDGVIIEDIPQKFELNENLIYSSLYWNIPTNEKIKLIKSMPENSNLILSFDSEQVIEKDAIEYKTESGALVMNQPSEDFIKCLEVAKENNINIIASTNGCGRTNEFGTVPYIPAMMQWFMRSQSIKQMGVKATIESERYGFIPNIVAEFSKHQSLLPCDEGGICIQKIASMHFGAENVEKVMMAFKKITDGVNWLVFNDADKQGPLQFGPAYPLINGNLYEYDFDKNDSALETDINMKACDALNKASLILSHIENDEAKELSYILSFAVNTIVTCANAKRWYRRICAIEKTDAEFKKNFLYTQMVKIGEQELKNAYETIELLINAPYLAQNNFEPLCTAQAIETKTKLTQKALNEIKKKINY